MPRPLLHAEAAILIEAGAALDPALPLSPRVLREYHPPPRAKRRQWFNTDFVIELCDPELRMSGTSARAVPIRPQSLGAEYFVTLSEDKLPLMLELLNGESIERSSFNNEIRQVEHALRNLWELPHTVSAKKAPYLRVARLQKCIAFWASSVTEISELLSAPTVRVDAGKNVVSYRVASGDILVDGLLYD